MKVDFISISGGVTLYSSTELPYIPIIGDQVQLHEGVFKVQYRYFAFGSNRCIIYGIIL